jgi:hypothetical protein
MPGPFAEVAHRLLNRHRPARTARSIPGSWHSRRSRRDTDRWPRRFHPCHPSTSNLAADGRSQDINPGAHRVRVGVVGIVEHHRPGCPERTCRRPLTPAKRSSPADHGSQGDTGGKTGGRRSHGIARVVGAPGTSQANLGGTLGRLQLPAFPARAGAAAMHIGRLVDAEAANHDAGRHLAPEAGIAVVGIDQRHARPPCRPLKMLPFSRATSSMPAHPLEMGALRIGQKRDSRRAKLGQVGNLAWMIHAHLNDRSPMRGVHARAGSAAGRYRCSGCRASPERVAELRLENGGDHFLGRRLAVRTGDGNHRQREAGAPGGGDPPEGEPRIGDDNR